MIGAALGFITGGSAARLVATLLAGVAIGGWGAWQVQTWRHGYNQAKQVQQQARDQVRHIENRDRASAAYQQGEADAEQQQIKIVERVRVINAGAAGAVHCLGADGLRELGAAIDNGAPAAAPSPGPAVPAAASPG